MREQIIMRDIVSTAQAAKAFKITPGTLSAWRQHNVGPPYFKLAGIVLYDRAELRAWFETRRREPVPELRNGKPGRPKASRKAPRCHKTEAHVAA